MTGKTVPKQDRVCQMHKAGMTEGVTNIKAKELEMT